MPRPSAPRRLLILLSCSALLLTGFGGVHWHLCFDGREAPVSLHVADSAVEHAAVGAGPAHRDQNIEIGVAPASKHTAAGAEHLPQLGANVPAVVALARGAPPSIGVTRAPVYHDLSLLLPPSRGPPTVANS